MTNINYIYKYQSSTSGSLSSNFCLIGIMAQMLNHSTPVFIVFPVFNILSAVRDDDDDNSNICDR